MQNIMKASHAKLFEISKNHNIAALCWQYMKKHDIPVEVEIEKQFNQEYAKTVYQSVQQKKAFDEVIDSFTRNGIYYLPLKGMVIRNF